MAGGRQTALWRRAAAGLAAGAALLVAAPGGGAVAAALSDCHIAGLRHDVQCGVLRRALDPARPDGAKIDIHFVVAPAIARRRLPDPVFVLAGGPGQSAIDVAPTVLALLSRVNNRRDVVFVDQRGTGRSAPLQCDDPKHESLADQSDPERQLALLLQCKRRLLRRPDLRNESDLGLFTTTLAMQDLDAVRRELGAARINLLGASYGTRAALEYLRVFPSAVRRLVLDGVTPPDMALPASYSTDAQAALDALFGACERDAQCRREYPSLRGDWAGLLASVPRRVSAPQPLTGREESFTLSREMLLGAVRGPLYAPWLAAGLPAAISDAAQGRYAAIAGMNAVLSSRKGIQLAFGMHLSVICAEDMPRVASSVDRPGADFGTDLAAMYGRLCSVWPRGAVPEAFYQVPPSRSPALLLSGGADPITPPRHAARVAARLGPLARQVVVPEAGHGVMSIGCAPDLLFRFIDAADDAQAVGVDASCLARVPRPPVFIPVAAAPTPASP